MVNIYILSYSQFKSTMSSLDWTDKNISSINDSAVISICNSDDSMSHWFKDEHDNVLNIDFDDTTFDDEEIGIKSISEEQAAIIVDFFERNVNKSNFVIHCEAGISRSSAVALCLIDFLHIKNIHDITLHQIQHISPNPKVERLLHLEFMKR